MKYFRITGSAHFCGTDFEEYIQEENRENAERTAMEIHRDNAEMYAYLAGDNEEEQEWYDENVINCADDLAVEEITKEEYDENIF